MQSVARSPSIHIFRSAKGDRTIIEFRMGCRQRTRQHSEVVREYVRDMEEGPHSSLINRRVLKEVLDSPSRHPHIDVWVDGYLLETGLDDHNG